MDRLHLVAAIVTAAGCAEPIESTCSECGEPPPSTLFITDRSANAIVRYDGATGAFRDVFEQGTDQRIDRPSSVRLGFSGDLYLAGYGRGDVVRYDVRTGAMMEVFYWDTTLLEEPVELLYRGEALLVLGKDTHNIVAIGADGTATGSIGSPELQGAHDFVVGPDGTLIVGTDTSLALGASVQIWNFASGQLVTTFGDHDQLASATGLALGRDGVLYVCDGERDQIAMFEPRTGAFLGTLVDQAAGLLHTPVSLDFGPDGALYVLDSAGLHRLDPHTGVELSLFVRADDGHLRGPRSFTFVTEAQIAALVP